MIRLPLANKIKIPGISLGSKKIFTGLEIDGSYIKVAQAEDFAGSRKITEVIIKKLAAQSEQAIVQALKDIASELKGQFGNLTLCVPRHKVTVRFLRFPTVQDREIAGMVALQSAKELPFSKEELISDYLITERTKDGYAKVALAIAHQDIIDGYLNILKKANLEPQRLTFSTEAILSWYRLAWKQQTQEACSILIDLDTDSTDIAILCNLRLGFTRGLNLGTVQLREQSDVKNKLAEEIRRTIAGYNRQEQAKKIGKIVLGPSAETIAGLNSFLAQEFNLPCETLAPFKNLSCKKEISTATYEPQISLFRVLGTVLEVKAKKLNLLPEVLSKQQQAKSKKKIVYTTFILLSAVFLLSLAVLAKTIHNKRLRIFYLQKEIASTQTVAGEVENMLKVIELIEARSRIEGSSIDVLRELHYLVPDDISLSSFKYDEDNKMLMLRGVSANMSKVSEFINKLEKSTHFEKVQLKYMGEKKARAAGLTDFKIECSLER